MTDVLRNGGRLTWSEARESPCGTCAGTYCCKHLVLHEFPLRALRDVDSAVFLLNFDGIVLGLNEKLEVTVYLKQSCGYLDQQSQQCSVYGTDLMPPICKSYPAYDCFYRRRMEHGNHREYPLMDRERMQWLASQLRFNEERQLAGGPAWDVVVEAFESMPIHHRPMGPPRPDPVRAEWEAVVLGRKDEPSLRPSRHQDVAVQDPCQGCGAWCCTVLEFERAVPNHASGLEHIRYMLGFPSVELGIADDQWTIYVHAECRHLEHGRCSVFGQDERPLRCRAYPALKCTFKPQFGQAFPEEYVRVSRDQFRAIERSVVYDELGDVLAMPPRAVVRQIVEDEVRKAAR